MLQHPGSSWGFGALLKDTSVVVLKEDTPPTNNPCWTWDSNPQPSAYKSDSLSIRPRLPQSCPNKGLPQQGFGTTCEKQHSIHFWVNFPLNPCKEWVGEKWSLVLTFWIIFNYKQAVPTHHLPCGSIDEHQRRNTSHLVLVPKLHLQKEKTHIDWDERLEIKRYSKGIWLKE